MNDFKPKWYQTLRIKFITLIIIVISIVVTALGFASYKKIEATRYAELEELTHISANRLSKHLALPMWRLDKEQVDELVKVEMEEQRVEAIVVRDEDQKTLYTAKQRGADGGAVDSVGTVTGDLFSSQREINKGEELIGTVSVLVTKEQTKNELRQFAYGVAIAVAILNLIIFIIMAVAISRMVLKPIEQLTVAAEKISRGDINHRINIRSNDEIGQLANANEKMQVSMKIMIKKFLKNRNQAS